MTFVSYAQNFEDIILWRAFSNVEGGFYIDVGAFDPEKDSVSLAFYQRGWRGVHVEPIPQFAERFRALRPEETVMEYAVSNAGEPVHLYRFIDNGMTTASLDFANAHRDAGFSYDEITVPSRSLSDVLTEAGRDDIHWLKVDVEGMEAAVLASWNDHPARPQVVVVEATKPRSSESTHAEWEHHLIQRDYRFVYFDGLNRFYVHATHPELETHFGLPPNVNDDFVLSDSSPFSASLNARLVAAEARLRMLETETPTNHIVLERIGAVGHTLRTEMLNGFTQAASQDRVENLLQKNAASHADDISGLRARIERLEQEVLQHNENLLGSLQQQSEKVLGGVQQQIDAQSQTLQAEQKSFLQSLASVPLARFSAMLRLLKGE